MAARSNRQPMIMGLGVLWLLLAVVLFFFQALQRPQVEITWTTDTEIDTAGFNLYRSLSPDGEFTLVNEEAMIPSQGGGVTGAEYRYVDSAVAPATTYYYLLEEVEVDATTNRYEDDMLSFVVPRLGWPWAAAAAVGAMVGLWLLVRGWRGTR